MNYRRLFWIEFVSFFVMGLLIEGLTYLTDGYWPFMRNPVKSAVILIGFALVGAWVMNWIFRNFYDQEQG